MQQLNETFPAIKTVELEPTQALSTHQVAKLCGVNSSSVGRWTTEHGLACYRTPGGHRRIVARDLVDFMRTWNIPQLFVLSSKTPR